MKNVTQRNESWTAVSHFSDSKAFYESESFLAYTYSNETCYVYDSSDCSMSESGDKVSWNPSLSFVEPTYLKLLDVNSCSLVVLP